MDTKELIKQQLESRKEQLRALIRHLEVYGENHPQYNQLENCKKEYELVISQLEKLNK